MFQIISSNIKICVIECNQVTQSLVDIIRLQGTTSNPGPYAKHMVLNLGHREDDLFVLSQNT